MGFMRGKADMAGGASRRQQAEIYSEEGWTYEPDRGKRALMKPNPSSAERGRLDNTPKWVDIQTCIITG